MSPEEIKKKKLAMLGVRNLEDMVYYYPCGYEDRLVKTSDLVNGEDVVFCGTIKSIRKNKVRPRLRIEKARLVDQDIVFTWFNQNPQIEIGQKIYVYGRVRVSDFGTEILVKEHTPAEEDGNVNKDFIGIIPIYPRVKGVSQQYIRKLAHEALSHYQPKELLNEDIVEKYKLMSHAEAIKQIHFPNDKKLLAQAKRRLAFEEVLLVQVALRMRRENAKKIPKPHRYTSNEKMTSRLISALPYKMTSAQTRTWNQIRTDMASPFPMNRLLFGDVGSGENTVSCTGLSKSRRK